MLSSMSLKNCRLSTVFLSYFFTPYLMRIEYFLQVRVPIFSRARAYRLGKGAKLYLDQVCDAMILFLHEQYELNPSCLFGDIQSLFLKKGDVNRKRLGELSYLEHLQGVKLKSL